MKTNTIEYQDGNITFIGYYAYDEKVTGKRPGILIAHDWSGQNEFARKKAQELAALGYAAFAIDMYGQGKTGTSKEEKSALIQPLLQDRAQLQKRITLALHALQKLDEVDPHKIGAIGFCFGGLCVLDLARSGAAVNGVVSFHGLLNAPENLPSEHIKAHILALHGYDDPMVTPNQVMQFGNEMTQAKADWQLTIYGNTMHGFTNPEANDPSFGTVYNARTTSRAWIAMQDFFKEIF